MSYAKNEQRSYERYDYPSMIEYVLEDKESEGAHKGVAINMSLSGFSAYLFESLPVGQKIVIKTGIPVAQNQVATLCWSRTKDPDFYVSGLKFT